MYCTASNGLKRKTLVCEYCGTTTINPYAAKGNTDNLVADEIKKGDAYLAFGEFSKALETFKSFSEDHPNDYRGHWGVVRALTKEFTDYDISLSLIDEAKEYLVKAQIVSNPKQKETINRTWSAYCKEFDKKQDEKEKAMLEMKQKIYKNAFLEFGSLGLLLITNIIYMIYQLTCWSYGFLHILSTLFILSAIILLFSQLKSIKHPDCLVSRDIIKKTTLRLGLVALSIASAYTSYLCDFTISWLNGFFVAFVAVVIFILGYIKLSTENPENKTYIGLSLIVASLIVDLVIILPALRFVFVSPNKYTLLFFLLIISHVIYPFSNCFQLISHSVNSIISKKDYINTVKQNIVSCVIIFASVILSITFAAKYTFIGFTAYERDETYLSQIDLYATFGDFSRLPELEELNPNRAPDDRYKVDFSKIGNLENLKVIDMDSWYYDEKNYDISGIGRLDSLERIYLNCNDISNIDELSKLSRLQILELRYNNISEISALKNLTDLLYLDLSYNIISDISPLANINNLEELYLSNNNISDVSPLANLNNLEELYLSNNNISDISSLYTLTNLRELWIDGNPLSQEQVDELQEALPDCYIYYW